MIQTQATATPPSTPTPRPAIALSGIKKIYGSGNTEVRALDGIDLIIHSGEYCAIMGASGSGKSTLMNMMGCLDRPTTGQYLLDGVDVSKLDASFAARQSNKRVDTKGMYLIWSIHSGPKRSGVMT